MQYMKLPPYLSKFHVLHFILVSCTFYIIVKRQQKQPRIAGLNFYSYNVFPYLVYLTDCLGLCQREDIVIPLQVCWMVIELGTTKFTFIKSVFLNHCAHSPIEDHDPFFQNGINFCCHWKLQQQKFQNVIFTKH